MNEDSWVKIYRKLTDWEWYTDSHMVHLYLHLLLKANPEDRHWRGMEVKRGQLVTSLDSLKSETKISTRTLRTCLQRLQDTGEITQKTTNRFRLITICKYESYQEVKQYNRQTNDKQTTSNRQTNDKQTTTTKEYKEYKNKRIILDDADACARTCEEEGKDEEEYQDEETKRILGFKTELQRNQTSMETTCMNLRITPSQYNGLIHDFTNEQIAKGTKYYSSQDFRRHAFDWIRSHIALNTIDPEGHTIEPKQKGQSNGNTNRNDSKEYGLSPKDRAIRDANRRDRLAMGLDPDAKPTAYGSNYEF